MEPVLSEAEGLGMTKSTNPRVLRDLRGLFGSFHVWKINIGCHPGPQSLIIVWKSNLDAEYLLDSIRHRLDVARCEFGLAIDLLDRARKIFTWE